jgi:hypothetical protein
MHNKSLCVAVRIAKRAPPALHHCRQLGIAPYFCENRHLARSNTAACRPQAAEAHQRRSDFDLAAGVPDRWHLTARVAPTGSLSPGPSGSGSININIINININNHDDDKAAGRGREADTKEALAHPGRGATEPRRGPTQPRARLSLWTDNFERWLPRRPTFCSPIIIRLCELPAPVVPSERRRPPPIVPSGRRSRLELKLN